MRYYALACDYDGTIATQGTVDDKTIQALEQLKASGRRLLLVTGRELDDLQRVFSRLDLFDMVVAENGALLFRPEGRKERILCDPPSQKFIEALQARGVSPLSIGRTIVATWEPHQHTLLEVIHELGLELQVIFNKGAVMVLPSGTNKATGLREALRELGFSPHNVVGIGDAENDHAFLDICECSVAIANALPSLKEKCDYTTSVDHGGGVQELIQMLLENDLEEITQRLTRHNLPIGTDAAGNPVRLPSYGISMMLTGSSGGGKTSLATSFLERLLEHKYQYCIIDPEGDYESFPEAVVLGSMKRPPTEQEVVDVLAKPESNCVVNMIGIAFDKRPAFFESLLVHLMELRVKTGRPHWLIIDEAHHLLPSSWEPAQSNIPHDLRNMVFITIHPHHMAKSVVEAIDAVIIVGKEPQETVQLFTSTLGYQSPEIPVEDLERGTALLWWRKNNTEPIRFTSIPPTVERHRHIRKYAEGELPPERSFFFKGPDGKLNLRAPNLHTFLQLAEGVDDETWMFHLKEGDYSEWFAVRIKDKELAEEARKIEQEIDPQITRQLIRQKIEERYTLPA